MLPPAFSIRDAPAELSAIQLDEKSEYDDLIGESPVATLGYIDDDDGEVITVGSSAELFDRVDELQSLRPVVFDLLTSLRSLPKDSNTAEGIRVWKEFVDRKYEQKRKGKEPIRPNEVLVDVSDDTTAKTDFDTEVKTSTGEVKPFLVAYEEELKKLFQNESQDPPEQQPRFVQPTSSAAAPISPADIVSQAIQSMSWASQSILSLRRDLPQRAQPAVESLGQAVYSAMGGLTMQLSQIAQDASEKAQRAANATREVDTAEIEAIKEKIRNLAVGIGHVAAQSATLVGAEAGEAANEVRKAADAARKELLKEMSKAREEIAQNVSDAVRGFSGGASSTAASAGTTATEKETATTDTRHMQPTATEVEDDSELYDAPGSSSNPNVTFAPDSSHFKSCADWLKDVKEQNATKTQETQSKEQDAVAFWQQMDRIAHYTAEQPGASSSASPTPQQKEEKGSEEQDSVSVSSISDEDAPHRRHSPRDTGRFSEESIFDQYRRLTGGSRRHHHHGPPTRHFPWYLRASPHPLPHFPPPPPHFPPPPTHFPPPPPHSPPRDREGYFPSLTHDGSFHPPPPARSGPHSPPRDNIPSSSFPFNAFHPPPPLPINFPPPPPPPAPPSHPHTSFRHFTEPTSRELLHRRSVNFDHLPAEHPSLRRVRTVATFRPPSPPPPHAPFQGPVDLSRSISPAPPMPSWQQVHEREDPFATPPRIQSPVAIPSPPEIPSPIRTSSPPAVPSPARFPWSTEAQVPASFEDVHETQPQVRSLNPFSFAEPPHPLPPPPPSPPQQVDNNPFSVQVVSEAVDRCVACLVEMGYGGADGDVDEVERLRIYAQISGGDLEEALEMLEEEKRAWEGH